MNILAILPRFPFPVDKGDKLRAYHHLKYLAEHHEISVFALTDEKVSENSLNELKSFCKHVTVYPLKKAGIYSRVGFGLFKKIPFQTAWHTDRAADQILKRKIEEIKPDVLFYQLVRTAELAKEVALPKVLDLQDPMSENIRLRLAKEPLWKRQVLKREYYRLLAYEAKMATHFDELCIISERDREDLPEPARSKAKIVSNGIDTDYYRPQYNTGKNTDLVFVGSMSYVPNVEAAKFIVNEILPELSKLGINASVAIVGAEPSAEVQKLQSDRVQITGRVPDTRTYYAQSRIMVAPMFINTGIQNKILEAGAMGLPIVTTDEANKAIGAEAGKEILLANTAGEFARQIALLLRDEKTANGIAEAGHRYILQNFSWETCGRQLEEILELAVEK